MKTILSIDGGGIRGIIPALFLTELERKTGKPIASLFDLMAGTSTGGIIALALSQPDEHGRPEHSAEDLVGFYEHEGPKIFSESVWRAINTFGYLFDEKYPPDRVERILHRYFRSTFLDEALTNVLVPSYEIERRIAYFFKSHKAKKNIHRNFLMRHIARATSAAPTYFQPEKIPTQDLSDYYALIDGGVFANNPAMCAYVEAKTMWPDEKDFLILSLGTGELTRPIYYQQAKDWGKAQWAVPILNVVFDGVSDTVDYQLRQLFPLVEGQRNYYRYQIRLDDASDDLDNVQPGNLRALKLYGEQLIRDNSDSIESLCSQLVKR